MEKLREGEWAELPAASTDCRAGQLLSRVGGFGTSRDSDVGFPGMRSIKKGLGAQGRDNKDPSGPGQVNAAVNLECPRFRGLNSNVVTKRD